MTEKFIVDYEKYANSIWWARLTHFCRVESSENGWHFHSVMARQLKPYGIKLVCPRTYRSYLRCDSEASLTAIILKWA